ncbi:site-specific integrase [Halomicroarcula sp. F13]|uniref:Site-specific integrase n=1 Tax=Haloarcula rubra TaxID=2487747 RepID=A0AAW4PNJ6_9EURY|nr:site-specific integrase [Halomicroarcula rubra]MBX0322593.1 site-specific integrase [Halomicroarcula rubra]
MSEPYNPFEDATEYEDKKASEMSNEELRDAFEGWAESNKKENTASFYKVNFGPFYDAINDHGKHLTEDVTRNVVKSFLENEAETLQPKTVGHRYSAISRFYSVLKGEMDLLPHDEPTPTERLDRGDVSGLGETTMKESDDTNDDAFHYLEPEEISELVNHVPEPTVRNRAMLLLMANTGLRASEIQEAKVESVDWNEPSLTVKSPKLSEENDPEIITVYWRSEKVTDALDAYVNLDRPSYPSAESSPYLFVSRQSEQIGYESIRHIVRTAADKAGLQEVIGTDANGDERVAITPHTLRHSFGMMALENGMNVNEVKNAMHHEKIETTMVYLREHEEKTKKAIQSKGPVLGFD